MFDLLNLEAGPLAVRYHAKKGFYVQVRQSVDQVSRVGRVSQIGRISPIGHACTPHSSELAVVPLQLACLTVRLSGWLTARPTVLLVPVGGSGHLQGGLTG